MKNIALAMFLFLSFLLASHSQNGVFSSVPICESFYDIVIDKNSSIDSLNECIKKADKENLRISLRGLSEVQMDSLLSLIYNSSLIDKIFLDSCPIKKLPIIFRKYFRLRDLTFYKCDSIESLNGFKSIQASFALKFFKCNIPKLPEGIENIKSILSLFIEVNKDYKLFNLEESLSTLTFRNNVRAFFIYNENLKEIPNSLDKLTLLSHLYLVCNEDVKIHNKLTNLVNLVDYMGNIQTENLLDEKITDNLLFDRYWNRSESPKWGDMDTETEEGLFNLIMEVLSTRIPYYYWHAAFYKDDLFLYVAYKEGRDYYGYGTISFPDKFLLEKEVKLDNNVFKIEKKLFVKTFKLKCLELESDDTARIRIMNAYKNEEILSFQLKKGEEYLVNLEEYPNYYFNIEFEINGKKFIRNVEMK